MMGRQPPPQGSLFYVGFKLDERIRENHPLRKIDEFVDFEFIYLEVGDKYGFNGEQAQEGRKGPMSRRFVSTTDPDAAMISKGKSKFRYKVHRAVDCASEVITSTLTTSGEIDDSHKMKSLMDSHRENTEVRAHMPDLKKKQEKSGHRKGIFMAKEFTYERIKDAYICPAGKTLDRKHVLDHRQSVDYSASAKDCADCDLRIRCTRNKRGRSVKRHLRQEELDRMRTMAGSASARRDIKTRQHLMERSFARSVRYGFKRARWRGLWKAEVQEYISCHS